MTFSFPKIKTSLFLWLAVAFFLSILPALSRERFARFVSPALHLSVPIPHDWLVIKGDSSHLFTAVSKKKNGDITFNIFVTPVEEPKKGLIKEELNIFTIVKSDTFKRLLSSPNATHGKTFISKQDAIWLQQTVPYENGFVSTCQILTMYRKKIFTVTFSAGGKTYDEALSVLRNHTKDVVDVRTGIIFTDLPFLQRTENVIVFWSFFALSAVILLFVRFGIVKKELPMPLAVIGAGTLAGAVALALFILRLFKDHSVTISLVLAIGIIILSEFSTILLEKDPPKKKATPLPLPEETVTPS